MFGHAHPLRIARKSIPIRSWRPYTTSLCCVLVLSGITGLLASDTVVAGTYYTSKTLDDINQHQAQGFLSLYLGDQLFLQPNQNAIAGNVALGSYGYEAISGMFGVTWQNSALHPVGLGLGYTYLVAEFRTRTFTLNTQYNLAGGNEPWLVAQAAVGRQFLTRGSQDEGYSFREGGESYPPHPDNPRILIDDFNWTYGFLHLVAQARIWLLRPQLDLGYLASWYSYSGNECVNGDCNDPGESVSRSGNDGRVVWGLGLGLDLTGFRLFVGMRPHSEMGTLVARMTLLIF
jgi:hypothetical protein